MRNNSKLLKGMLIGGILLFVVGGFVRERSENGRVQKEESKKASESLEKLVGGKVPDFSLSDMDGNIFTAESLRGKKVVLFFNEGLACYPACWDQMKQLSSDQRFSKDDTAVFSVVTDSKSSWKSAIEKKPDLGGIKVLFDEGAAASKAFNALDSKSSMHAGVPGHTYVIIDKEGIVRWVLDDPRMGINNGEVFSQLGKLQ